MPRYQTKPQFITAHRFQPDEGEIPAGVVPNKNSPSGWSVTTKTLYGDHIVWCRPGYWVLTDDDGVHYVRDADEFAEEYVYIGEDDDA